MKPKAIAVSRHPKLIAVATPAGQIFYADPDSVNSVISLTQVRAEIAYAIAQHVAALDPHSQYALKEMVSDAIAQVLSQLEDEILSTIQQHIAQVNPHPQYELVTAANYQFDFTQGDISIVGLLGVVHSLNSYPSGIAIFDENGIEVQPDGWRNVSVNEIAVDLSSFVPILDTWTISITP